MCYSIPGKVIDIQKNIALIDYFGEKKEALIDVEDIKIGDYVYAQGGVIVQDLQEDEALSILNSWEEIFFQLKEKDRRLAEESVSATVKDFIISETLEKAEKGGTLTKDEILTLLTRKDTDELDLIYQAANRIRQRVHKNSSCVHGIIEFSNICKNDCAYCGIRRDNHNLKRYRMKVDEIVDVVTSATEDLGFKAFVLQSGEDDYYTTERLIEIVQKIRDRCGLLIFLSIGERDRESYKELYDAGARGVLFRFETSSPGLYEKLHTTLRYENRIRILKDLKDIGYIIATGSLIGLPCQSDEDLIEDILLAGSFEPEMYSFGPFIPHPATPLAAAQAVDIDRALKILSIIRLINHDANILVTSALETLSGRDGAKKALMAGGNSMMINLTPERYRGLYSIYPGKDEGGKKIQERISETISLLHSLGRAPTDIGIGTTK